MGSEGIGKAFVGGHKGLAGDDRQRNVDGVVDRALKAGGDCVGISQKRIGRQRRKL